MKIRNGMLLTLTAFIWGLAFIAQQEGGELAGPYTFNGIRSLIGSAVLVPVILIFGRKMSVSENRKTLVKGGVTCGILLFLASTTQQLGLYYGSGVGKAGFLTACYILIVPILGLFVKKKVGINIWIGVLLALVGLYLLCMQGGFYLELCDVLLIICAFLFSLHILAVDYYSPKVNGVAMSCIQFFVCGMLSMIPMFFVDMKHSFEGMEAWAATLQTWNVWSAILYAGVLSCGVAYTLQIIGQKGVNPTIASLIMSLESVFSVLGGWLLLGQTLSGRELCGCGLLFSAIVLAQLPIGRKKE